MDPASVSWDRAEFDRPALANHCARCQQPLADEYFEAAGHLLCGSCRAALDARWVGGSAPGRVLKAIAFGAAAAGLGSAVYFGLAMATGYEIGLVAILVGWLVGTAIRRATNYRGGRGYQALAVALTYAAIVSTYVPPIWRALQPRLLSQDLTWRAAGVVIVLAWIAPFLGGFKNFIGWIVIGIGLYQAWMLTRPVRVTCTGPYALKRAPPS